MCFFWYHCKLYCMLTSTPKKNISINHYSPLNWISHINTDIKVMQSIWNVDYFRKAWHLSIKSLLNQHSGYKHSTFYIELQQNKSTLKQTVIPPTHQGNLHCRWRGGGWRLHRGRAQLPPFYLFYGRCDVLHVKAKIPTAWGRNEVNTQPD